MARPNNDNGFTLLELLIVVAIIGILSAIGIPLLSNYQLRAQAVSAAADLRIFRDAFIAVSMENGQFPNDSHIVLPPAAPGEVDVAQFIDNARWLATTPVGGNYNWEGPDAYPYAGVSILGATVPQWVMESVDGKLDDGDLATGIFRLTPNGRHTYIFEE